MTSSFADSFEPHGDDSPDDSSTQPFAEGYFDSHVSDSASAAYVSGGLFSSDPADFSSEIDVNGPILPPYSETDYEEAYALREWRRQNAIRLEEKEKREKELLRQILLEADEYKIEFHKKRQITCESNKLTNREREKIFVASQETFYAEADKDYWKSIAELIPNEVLAIEKRKGKKEQENKPSIVIVQGPKSGKPTDLTRMRQILVKLKHNPPQHLKLSRELAPDVVADPSAIPKAAAAPEVAAAH